MAFSFGPAQKPTLNLGTSTTNIGNPSTSLFGASIGNTQQNTSNNPPQNNVSYSQAQIDIPHLRPTTKFEQLTPELQRDIEGLDNAILNQMRQASEVGDLIPAVISAGQPIPNAVDFISQKLDEVETGLENDAVAIVKVKNEDVKKVEGEAKCVFRAVDRLKMPRQYQVGHTQNESLTGSSIYGGNGLNGWWNNPQTLRGSMRPSAGQGVTMQLPEDESEDSTQGPTSLVELFTRRTAEMNESMANDRQLLGQIEEFVYGLERKVRSKERELNERLNYGDRSGGAVMEEREHQIQLLKYVFGEVQRNLYEVADKIGGCRDGVLELGMRR